MDSLDTITTTLSTLPVPEFSDDEEKQALEQIADAGAALQQYASQIKRAQELRRERARRNP
jgi:hypothetical protein